jgi:hypothetical protein
LRSFLGEVRHVGETEKLICALAISSIFSSVDVETIRNYLFELSKQLRSGVYAATVRDESLTVLIMSDSKNQMEPLKAENELLESE